MSWDTAGSSEVSNTFPGKTGELQTPFYSMSPLVSQTEGKQNNKNKNNPQNPQQEKFHQILNLLSSVSLHM